MQENEEIISPEVELNAEEPLVEEEVKEEVAEEAAPSEEVVV